MLLNTKYSSENVKLRHFGKKHGKITAFWQNHGIHGHGFRDFCVSMIIYCP